MDIWRTHQKAASHAVKCPICRSVVVENTNHPCIAYPIQHSIPQLVNDRWRSSGSTSDTYRHPNRSQDFFTVGAVPISNMYLLHFSDTDSDDSAFDAAESSASEADHSPPGRSSASTSASNSKSQQHRLVHSPSSSAMISVENHQLPHPVSNVMRRSQTETQRRVLSGSTRRTTIDRKELKTL